MRKTYTLVVCIHGTPAALALFLDGPLGGFLAQVAGDDGAGSLHIQKVWCQGSLGSVRVVRALFALLLLVKSMASHHGDGHRDGADRLQHVDTGIKGEELTASIDAGSLTEQKICLAEILCGEIFE